MRLRTKLTPEGIDPTQMKEGTCFDGETTAVVVDRGDTLNLQTLAARLEGTRERASLSGPAGTEAAQGRFFTFDLAITNMADYSVTLVKDQLTLLLGKPYGEDIEVEKRFEPHSLLVQKRLILPGETVHGTVTFEVPTEEVGRVAETGNLEIANFGVRGDAYEPEAIFNDSEMGVMRTYGAH